MKKIHIGILFVFFLAYQSCKEFEEIPFKNIPKEFSILNSVVDNPEKYKAQVIYTQIDRNENNEPEFTDFNLNLNDGT